SGSAVVKFPSVYADFEMHWAFAAADPAATPKGFGGSPTIAFNNVRMGLGSFLSDIMGPVVRVVQTLTVPLQPVISVLNEPIPGLSDLSKAVGSGDVSLLTLAKVASSTGALPD